MQLSECFGLPGPSKVIEIPEFSDPDGGPVRVKVEILNVRQQAEVETLIEQGKHEQAMAKTILFSCRHTETGEPLFQASQLDDIAKFPITVSNRITGVQPELRDTDRVDGFKKN